MYRVEFSLPFTLDCEFVVRKLLILVHQASRSMFTEDGILNNEEKTAALKRHHPYISPNSRDSSQTRDFLCSTTPKHFQRP